jgi:phenylacetate-CoA ligase
MSPVHADLQKLTYISWTDFLRKADTWTVDQIADYQLRELQRIIQYAYDQTSGYRMAFDRYGVSPELLGNLEDLCRFPFIEKETIRDHLEEFSVPMNNRTYVTTGGSTGIPLGLYRDPQAFHKELASKAHQYYRVGWREGERQMVMRGLPIDTPDHIIVVPEFYELRCSSYHLTPDQMERYRQRAWEYAPDWLRCYPSSGHLFARWLKETGKPFPPLKGILCASENLYDFQKRLISQVFKTRVFSHYGHYELAVLAGFCEHTDLYHVLPQYGYAELIGHDNRPVTVPGQMGEIVGTSFIMLATPLIRYRTRDFAVLKGWGCSACGRPYQLWERVEGRLQEFILTHTGRYISMTAMNFHDDIFDHLKQFQFYQKERGRVTFQYIPKPSCNEAILQKIVQRLYDKLGEDIELQLQAVEGISLTSRGKHRFLIQKLQLNLGDT